MARPIGLQKISSEVLEARIPGVAPEAALDAVSMVMIPPELMQRLQVAASQQGVSVAALVAKGIDSVLMTNESGTVRPKRLLTEDL